MDVSSARQAFFKAAEGKGGTCPCCDRWGRINPYHLNSGMARGLIWLYHWNRVNGWHSYCHLPSQANRMVLTANSMGKLRHWGLVIRDINNHTKKAKSGMYRISQAGRWFIDGKTKAPEKIWIYNDEPYSRAEKLITIQQALGEKFDFEKVMNDHYQEAK